MGEPTQIGRVLSSFLKRGGMEKRLKQKQAVLIWDMVVGEKVAAESRAIKVEDSKIFVKVKNPVWRTELFLMKEKILHDLNSHLGQKGIIVDLVLFGE